VGDERSTGGFDTAPERRSRPETESRKKRGRLPTLIALSALVTLGVVLGVVNSGSDDNLSAPVTTRPDVTQGLADADIEILPAGEGACVDDEVQTCENFLLVSDNDASLRQRRSAIDDGLERIGFQYVGPFEPPPRYSSRGVGLLFRRDQEVAAVYLQPDAIADDCSVPLPSCEDILSLHS
jgi:hypothetical protein